MVNALIKWCLDNVLLMLIAMAAVVAGGIYALQQSHVDAIPDIGEKQVIVFADWPGRSPQDVDDQVTYPLTISLTGTPGVKTIRSMSGFGFTMVFVIFKDQVDYYWARSRVLERMNLAQQRLPTGVVPVLGPDATALGQIYWYTVEGEGFDLAELRSIQDWYIRYQLNAVEGVSEVASIGGYVKQYQIDLHPDKLHAHRVSLMDTYNAVMRANIDVGAKVIEQNGIEFFIRGIGFVKSLADLEHIVIRQEQGTPLYLKNVATVTLGPDFRRGALDKAGAEVVGGVVTMRYGENPREVMERVRLKLAELTPGLARKTLPDGRVSQVRIIPFYDRTDIIRETMDTLKEALTEEVLVASLVIVLFLLHLRSTICVLVTFPLSVLLCFMLMYWWDVDANIMSLAGLAIAIGDVADMGIIMTENIYRHMAMAAPGKPHLQRIYEGASEVGGAILTAVSNTIISFIPVFFLSDQEGKLFRPLAFTKTFAIGASALLALTVVPLLCALLFRPITASRRQVYSIAVGLGVLGAWVAHAILMWGYAQGTHLSGWPMAIAIGVIVSLAVARMAREGFLPLEANVVSRLIARGYQPTLYWVLQHKGLFLTLPGCILFLGMTIWLGIGVTLYPLEWLSNRFAYEPLSPELRARMYVPQAEEHQRPLLELSELRWQRLRQGGTTRTRLLWCRQDPQETAAERLAGITVLQEGRLLPGLGREFMPPLDEGSFLYMPSLLPHAALSQAIDVNKTQDLAIATVPEVASVVGKLGRADTALDPAPIGMFETMIILKPVSEWRLLPVRRWFSAWPAWCKRPLTWLWPETRPITKTEILAEMQEKTAIPGVLPTWLQPIQTRLVMLQTGFRAMMGIKIYGANLQDIERIGLQMEEIVKRIPGGTDVVARPYRASRISNCASIVPALPATVSVSAMSRMLSKSPWAA